MSNTKSFTFVWLLSYILSSIIVVFLVFTIEAFYFDKKSKIGNIALIQLII